MMYDGINFTTSTTGISSLLNLNANHLINYTYTIKVVLLQYVWFMMMK